MLLQSRVHEVDYRTSRSVLVHVVGIVEIVSVLTDFACVREDTDDQRLRALCLFLCDGRVGPGCFTRSETISH